MAYPPADEANRGRERWYVRSGGTLRGQFPWENIVTNYYLGRLFGADEVSRDQHHWYPLFDVLAAQSAQPTASVDGHSKTVRLSPAVLARRERAARVWRSLHGLPRVPLAPTIGFGVFVACLLVTVVLFSGQEPATVTDCDVTLAAGRNFDFCSKAGIAASGRKLEGLVARNIVLTGAILDHADLRRADLSYAEMTGADLALADLGSARLVGASLRTANLSHARLREADLRYVDLAGASLRGADLDGARLDHAIWIDGRVCARNSRGECRIQP